MLVNEKRLEEIVGQINAILANMDKRLKELENAKEERTSQRQSTSKSNVVRKKS